MISDLVKKVNRFLDSVKKVAGFLDSLEKIAGFLDSVKKIAGFLDSVKKNCWIFRFQYTSMPLALTFGISFQYKLCCMYSTNSAYLVEIPNQW